MNFSADVTFHVFMYMYMYLGILEKQNAAKFHTLIAPIFRN